MRDRMPDSPDRRTERDHHLLRRLGQNADDLRLYLREWIQAELKEARIQLQLVETTSTGSVRRETKGRLQRVNDIDRRELREIEERFEQRLATTSQPGAKVATARADLEEALAAYERLVRELLALRDAWVGLTLARTK